MAAHSNINVLAPRLVAETLRLAKWVEKNGNATQKNIMRQYFIATVKVLRKLGPDLTDFQVPVWQLPSREYFVEPEGFHSKPEPIPPTEQEIEQATEQGKQAFLAGIEYHANPHKDSKLELPWSRGFNGAEYDYMYPGARAEQEEEIRINTEGK